VGQLSIGLIIYDDQTFTRAGIRALLASEPDIKVLEDLGNGAQVLRQIERRCPDVVLTGALREAVRIVSALRERIPQTERQKIRVIALVNDEEESHVVDALLAGVSGVVCRSGAPADLLHAIRVVAAGHASLTPTAARQLLDWAALASPPRRDPPETPTSLTPTEMKVLTLIASGVSGSDAAGRLGVSDATIRSHIHHMLTKLGLRSRAEIVAFAYKHRIVSP
jgi:DNA-binding NarL/FixJ family response regulator